MFMTLSMRCLDPVGGVALQGLADPAVRCRPGAAGEYRFQNVPASPGEMRLPRCGSGRAAGADECLPGVLRVAGCARADTRPAGPDRSPGLLQSRLIACRVRTCCWPFL